jgi:acetyl-CoA synthetase (ADP-forming)
LGLDLERILSEGRQNLSEAEAKTLIKEHGMPTTEFSLPSREELSSLPFQFPVAIKVNSPDVLHKTDVGGVFIDVKDWEELVRRYDEICERFPDAQVLVEHMEEGDAEFIVGLLKDPVFGLSIMFGTGGIMTELYKDVTFRKVPIGQRDAEEMLDEIVGGRMLRGFRGIKADREAMKRLLLSTSRLGEELEGRISQLDLNPVIVKREGVVVVDAKIILEER